MKRFEGKVVLVTGGNRNTGIEIVDLFVREGAQVFMCGSTPASTAKGEQILRARGIGEFTTSLTVSPHKVSSQVFAAGREAGDGFAEIDFKKGGGFQLSVARSKELNLYRQSYCGCEFSHRK